MIYALWELSLVILSKLPRLYNNGNTPGSSHGSKGQQGQALWELHISMQEFVYTFEKAIDIIHIDIMNVVQCIILYPLCNLSLITGWKKETVVLFMEIPKKANSL